MDKLNKSINELSAGNHKTHCICGTSLTDSSFSIEKKTSQGTIRFLKCPSCGSFMQKKYIDNESLSAWYDSQEYQGGEKSHGQIYIDYLSEEKQRLKEAHNRYKQYIEPIALKNSNILEIGCATGTLLAVCKEYGHNVMGCDLSTRFSAYGEKEYGIRIDCKDYLDLSIQPESLDIILMFGTVSNVQDLPGTLERIKTHLKPEGTLLCNLPLADSWPAKLYGDRYWMFTPSISTFMTMHGLQTALNKADLSIDYICIDRQQPSLRKILGHAKFRSLIFLIERLGLKEIQLPFYIPIPGVYLCRAIKNK